jgi:D-glucuronyl C5-epimerase C-terminus
MDANLGDAPVAMRLAVAAAAAVALLAALPAGSAPRPRPAALIAKGLARSNLSAGERARYGAVVGRVIIDVKRLPKLRAQLLQNVLAEVAAQWRAYTAPRALVLFSTLELNADWLEHHALPGTHPDLVADDGVVYRFFWSHGYVYHPLANFAKLNLEAASGDEEATERHAQALLARAIPLAGKLVWEYEFPFASGRAPWTSGMAQAVAAQALARAGDVLSDPALLDAADAAYAAIPGLLSGSAPAKPWVALYSFDRTPVLNAQLQSALSVGDYAELAGDPAAAAFAERLVGAAAKLLPRFDTGYWSLYSLRGDDSPLDYHDYVITLLRKLGARTGEPSWSETAERFHAYESQPPVIRVAPLPRTLPRRHKAAVRFWLSKRSSVTFRVGRMVVNETFGHGRHTIVWAPRNAVPGTYHPRLTAVAPNGLRVEKALPPVRIASGPPSRR